MGTCVHKMSNWMSKCYFMGKHSKYRRYTCIKLRHSRLWEFQTSLRSVIKLQVSHFIKVYARLKSIGIVRQSCFLFPPQYIMTLYLLADDEQLCVYIVSVNLLHKVGAMENIGPMQGIILNGLLRALRRNLAFTLTLSLLLPHYEETLLVTPSLC